MTHMQLKLLEMAPSGLGLSLEQPRYCVSPVESLNVTEALLTLLVTPAFPMTTHTVIFLWSSETKRKRLESPCEHYHRDEANKTEKMCLKMTSGYQKTVNIWMYFGSFSGPGKMLELSRARQD